MSLRELGPAPADPTNRVADDPRAADFGRKLFVDTRLSATGQVSCATCHIPERAFQDGIPLAKGVGATTRRTMPLAGVAHSPFFFWDGRKDSLWAQALGPLESPVEHGGSREQYALVIAEHYRLDYEAVFGAIPSLSTRDGATLVFVNAGKAIAAYERTMVHAPSRFDRYVDALQDTGRAPQGVLSADEVAGMRLFIGKAGCLNCHNGPLLTNNEFHNTGVPARPRLPADLGRLAGADAVLRDEFNCRSRWSDDRSRCAELEFMVTRDPVLTRAFKVPSLRDVAERAPYMHAGQFSTLDEVVHHYDRAPKAPAGHSELEPLRLSAGERRQLEAFLRSLSGESRVPR
jgi:cytochrome c peroxidase